MYLSVIFPPLSPFFLANYHLWEFHSLHLFILEIVSLWGSLNSQCQWSIWVHCQSDFSQSIFFTLLACTPIPESAVPIGVSVLRKVICLDLQHFLPQPLKQPMSYLKPINIGRPINLVAAASQIRDACSKNCFPHHSNTRPEGLENITWFCQQCG